MIKKEPKVKIIPLGGLYEVGKNLTVIEYGKNIILIDCGIIFPEEEMLGVDVVIPDMNYLIKNKQKVKALILTHGHEDHIGAIPYLLKEMNIPVYGTKLTLGLVKNKLKEHNLPNTDLKEIMPYGDLKIGPFEFEFIRMCHSMPDAIAIAVHTPAGTIVHTGDFKIDYTPINGESTDLYKLAELGKKGVLALLSDSTNVERLGHTMPEKTVGDTFERQFLKAKQRIIVATFASNIYRVQQIINTAVKFDRKVVISGRSMVNVSTVARELGYLNVPEGTIIDINEMNNYDPDKIVIITTGSQGEQMSALSRIAASDHRKIELVPGDLVIMSSTPIPGNEKAISDVINKLFRIGAEVIYEAIDHVHVSGHAYQEELKLVYSLLQPKYFIPVHGEYRHLRKHAELAKSMGGKEENIFLLENGSVLELSETAGRVREILPIDQILVDGLGVGDVGNIVLRDRKHLSEEGLLIVVVTISRETGAIIAGPDVISRGFVYVRESEELIEGARQVVRKSLLESEKKKIKDWATMKTNIRSVLRSYVYGVIKRNPMILPIIMEI